MRRIILVLILPFLVFACGDDLFDIDIDFDYDFTGDFDLPELAEGLHEIDSDIIELTVLEELKKRNLADISSASLKQLSLEIPQTEQLDWSFIQSAEVLMIVDGQETPMASFTEIPSTIGKTLNLHIEADEFRLIDFLDAETAQARLRVNLRQPLTKKLKIAALAGTKISARTN
ncbi:MAG: hypothetical protein AAF587_15985 [Bacteroidota bacterium]